jgi:uncharacterized membrane protein HdeD (DUF308 family)
MSDTGRPTDPPEPSPVAPPSSESAPQRSGCLTAFMAVSGVILLLPGLCALLFGGLSLSEPHFDSTVTAFVLVGLLAGFFGIWLIWAAIRGRRS